MPRNNSPFGQTGHFPMWPVEPSRWEKFLKELKLTEPEALAMLESGSAPRLHGWIRKNHTSAFVPEAFLSAAGIDTKLLFVDWQ